MSKMQIVTLEEIVPEFELIDPKSDMVCMEDVALFTLKEEED